MKVAVVVFIDVLKERMQKLPLLTAVAVPFVAATDDVQNPSVSPDALIVELA